MRYVLVILLAGQPKPVEAEVHDSRAGCRAAVAELATRTSVRAWCRPSSSPLWRMRAAA